MICNNDAHWHCTLQVQRRGEEAAVGARVGQHKVQKIGARDTAARGVRAVGGGEEKRA